MSASVLLLVDILGWVTNSHRSLPLPPFDRAFSAPSSATSSFSMILLSASSNPSHRPNPNTPSSLPSPTLKKSLLIAKVTLHHPLTG